MRESFPFELMLLTSPYMRCRRRSRRRTIKVVMPMKHSTPRMLPAIMLVRSLPLERGVRRFIPVALDPGPARVRNTGGEGAAVADSAGLVGAKP